jgi:two-component system cell cycle response regulator DivK
MTTMHKTVLIVEDNVLNQRLIQDILESQGINTLQTTDGAQALDLAHEYRPDLILMDIQLPGISGLEITRRIKADESLRSIPVIAVTAFAMKGDEERVREAGCDAYISKPIFVIPFIETVLSYLGEEKKQPAPTTVETGVS